MPHVLSQGAGVGLVVLEEPGRATLRLLDQLPVPLVGRVQEGTAHPQQILRRGGAWSQWAAAPHLLIAAIGPHLCLNQPWLPTPTMLLLQTFPAHSGTRASQALCLDPHMWLDADSSPAGQGGQGLCSEEAGRTRPQYKH